MSSRIIQQRCFNHVTREAVARCPECTNFYCRECITEHDGRVLCATCLEALTAARGEKSRQGSMLVRAFQICVGIFLLWAVFYMVGEILLRLPSALHEGTMWEAL